MGCLHSRTSYRVLFLYGTAYVAGVLRPLNLVEWAGGG